MDELKKIKEIPITSDIFFGRKIELTIEQRDWVITEIEQLEKKVKWLIKDYAKYMKMKSFRYCTLNIEKAEEDIRKALIEAMDKK